MDENALSRIIIDKCIDIHRTLGQGLLESVYEEILCYEFNLMDLNFERQKGLPVIWKGIRMDLGFRTDVIIDKKVIVELKSVESISPIHSKILLTYLKLTNIKLGLLLNFNVPLMKDGITRLVNNL